MGFGLAAAGLAVVALAVVALAVGVGAEIMALIEVDVRPLLSVATAVSECIPAEYFEVSTVMDHELVPVAVPYLTESTSSTTSRGRPPLEDVAVPETLTDWETLAPSAGVTIVTFDAERLGLG